MWRSYRCRIRDRAYAGTGDFKAINNSPNGQRRKCRTAAGKTGFGVTKSNKEQASNIHKPCSI